METLLYVRWGAAKFVQGQARFAADNVYDPDVEPTDGEWLSADAKTRMAKLLSMLRPTFPVGISDANRGALLSGRWFLVFFLSV